MSAPYKIVSLADMLQLPLEKLTKSFHQLTRLQGLMQFMVHEAPGKAWAMSDENLVLYKATCRDFAECANALDLKHCRNLATQFLSEVLEKSRLGQVEGQKVIAVEEILVIRAHRFLSALGDALASESAGKLFLALSQSEAELFEGVAAFGPEVEDRFPCVAHDIDEFAKSSALGRHTAAVFHLMRTLEAGLRAMSLCLGSTKYAPGHGRAWGAILNDVRDLRTGNPPAWAENDLFSGYYALLDAVMRAWRNPTMHIENKYDAADVQRISPVVMHFMQALAKRMNESGLPKA